MKGWKGWKVPFKFAKAMPYGKKVTSNTDRDNWPTQEEYYWAWGNWYWGGRPWA